jgi:tRNA(fMet)-specific endonuclease VapC
VTCLLDSDVVINFLDGRVEARQTVEALRLGGVAISLITLGEVYEGAIFGRDPINAEANLERFLRAVRIVDLDRSTMRRFALLRGALRRQGQLISDTDLLIAATAIEHNLTLVTRNVRHFGRIPGLSLLP